MHPTATNTGTHAAAHPFIRVAPGLAAVFASHLAQRGGTVPFAVPLDLYVGKHWMPCTNTAEGSNLAPNADFRLPSEALFQKRCAYRLLCFACGLPTVLKQQKFKDGEDWDMPMLNVFQRRGKVVRHS